MGMGMGFGGVERRVDGDGGVCKFFVNCIVFFWGPETIVNSYATLGP